MNYISLFSLLLGIVSIYITLKYTENYDKLSNTKQSNQLSGIISNILSDIEIKTEELPQILTENKDEFVTFFKKILKKENTNEKFVNYNYYLDRCQREICSNKDNKYLNSNQNLKSNKGYNYNNEIELAYNNISKNEHENNKYFKENKFIKNTKIKHDLFGYNLDKTSNIDNQYDYKNLDSEDEPIKKIFNKGKCVSQYGNKTFTNFVHEPQYCLGRYVSCK